MRAARLYGAADLRVGEEPAPEAGACQSLVRVTAVGICGSDLHWYSEGAIGDAKIARPLVPGHEGAGVVADGPRRGERVAIDPAIPCERCRACRDCYRNLCYNIVFSGHGETDGMMRELMPWPSHLLHPLPDAMRIEPEPATSGGDERRAPRRGRSRSCPRPAGSPRPGPRRGGRPDGARRLCAPRGCARSWSPGRSRLAISWLPAHTAEPPSPGRSQRSACPLRRTIGKFSRTDGPHALSRRRSTVR